MDMGTGIANHAITISSVLLPMEEKMGFQRGVRFGWLASELNFRRNEKDGLETASSCIIMKKGKLIA